MNRFNEELEQGAVQIPLSAETLDDNSVAVNFDMWDNENGQVVAQAGYVLTRQDDQDKCFYVTVFNAEGDVLSETVVPMHFNEC
jgi:hypothetical protein